MAWHPLDDPRNYSDMENADEAPAILPRGDCVRCKRREDILADGKCGDCVRNICRQCRGRNVEPGAICATCAHQNSTEQCLRCKRWVPFEDLADKDPLTRTCNRCQPTKKEHA